MADGREHPDKRGESGFVVNPYVVIGDPFMSGQQSPPEFFTPDEVVHLLRIQAKRPRQSLLKLRRKGLPATFVLGRFLYPRQTTLEFIQSRLPQTISGGVGVE